MESIVERVFRLYDDGGMTAEGRDTMEAIFRANPNLLDHVLAASKSESYWSHRRFATLEDINAADLDSDTQSLHEQRARAAARYLTHVVFYAN